MVALIQRLYAFQIDGYIHLSLSSASSDHYPWKEPIQKLLERNEVKTLQYMENVLESFKEFRESNLSENKEAVEMIDFVTSMMKYGVDHFFPPTPEAPPSPGLLEPEKSSVPATHKTPGTEDRTACDDAAIPDEPLTPFKVSSEFGDLIGSCDSLEDLVGYVLTEGIRRNFDGTVTNSRFGLLFHNEHTHLVVLIYLNYPSISV